MGGADEEGRELVVVVVGVGGAGGGCGGEGGRSLPFPDAGSFW